MYALRFLPITYYTAPFPALESKLHPSSKAVSPSASFQCYEETCQRRHSNAIQMRNRGSAQSLLVSATDLSISPSAARRVTAVHLPFKLRSGLMLLKEQLKLEKKKKAVSSEETCSKALDSDKFQRRGAPPYP